jgi:hypothetical protein
MNNPLDVGKSDASSIKVFGTMQALKHTEEFVDVPHIESYAIITNKEHDLTIAVSAADLNLGLGTPLCVLDGIFHEIAQHQP